MKQNQFLNYIPHALIYLRIVLAVCILLFALFDTPQYPFLFCILIVTGIVTDIFDGIIARKVNISSPSLRILDSNVDMIFWTSIFISAIIKFKPFFIQNAWWVFIVLLLEFISYAISYIKFRKTIATHTIFAKVWAVTLLVFFIDLFYTGQSGWAFFVCIATGIVSRIEIIGIILFLKQWETDVPSLFSVNKLNKGEKIKRFKLFN